MNTLQDIVIFCGKGCQVVKTPINTGVATSKRLSEVVIRLSVFWGVWDGGLWMENSYCLLENTHAV